MGLTPSVIDFAQRERLCAWVTVEPMIGKTRLYLGEVVYYDATRKDCGPPWELAKHEACHRVYSHGYRKLSRKQQEKEIHACVEEWYR
jgi:hypothetical protein